MVGPVGPGLLDHHLRLWRMFLHVGDDVPRPRLEGFRPPAVVARLLDGDHIPGAQFENRTELSPPLIDAAAHIALFRLDIAPVARQFAAAEIGPLKVKIAPGGLNRRREVEFEAVGETVADGEDIHLLCS